ncbi:MAG: hypothetical protein HY348_12865 [Nitrospira defluvii]|nr:hypothetical protein [Nitrospira defluvii]
MRFMSDESSQTARCLRTWLICGLAGMTVGMVMDRSLVSADEAVTVQEVLADPALFHLRQITLRGTVRNVQPLDPYEIPAGSTCYGGYLFSLEDDTATLPVAVPGLCGVPMVKDPDVEDGARVAVDATVQAPSHGGYALSFKGGKIAMDQEGVVQAIANRITPLVE